MSDFIVLGIIPGTNIQIGLLGWILIAAAIVMAAYLVRRIRRARALRFLHVHVSLTIAMRRRFQRA
jgi:hypothetical protein